MGGHADASRRRHAVIRVTLLAAGLAGPLAAAAVLAPSAAAAPRTVAPRTVPLRTAAQRTAAQRTTVSGGTERITDYQVRLTLRRDASMHVREQITYSFGDADGKHGIKRIIPVQFAYDDENTRVYPLTHPTASSPTGAPHDLDTTYGPSVTLRVGDPDRTVGGTQQYVLDYDLGGVVNGFTDRQELYWNAIGDEWQVPIDRASVTVEGPAAVTRATCFEGAQASTTLCRQTQSGGRAGYAATGLGPQEGLTVVAAFPAGTFPDAHPILHPVWSVRRAFALTPATGAGSLALLALIGGGALFAVSRAGRDRRYLGVVPGLLPASTAPGGGTPGGGTPGGRASDGGTPGPQPWIERVPMFRRDPIAVQFQPPKGMRPGQLGTLIDEHANVVDVTATLIDLAVRGFLQIAEVRQEGWFRSGDWRLTMIWPAPAHELETYESTLLKAVFDGRNEVLLSDLKQTFRSDLLKVQSELYEDVTARGWFHGNPQTVRVRWRMLGVLVVAAGAGLTWLLAKGTTYGLVGIGAVLGGLLLTALAGRMPARTATGTAMLAQARGFRLYLETAEANQIRFEEGQDIFSRYLPYAIVFGVAERWAGIFAQLAASGVRVDTPTWYIGANGYSSAGLFDFGGFGHAMDSFATTTSGSIAAATPSSSGSSGFSGGFSGGGGGGGGGGSW